MKEEQLKADGANSRTPKMVVSNGVDRFLADGVLYFDDVAVKEQISVRKHQSFEKAAPLLDRPVETVFFPYKDYKFKAYLRLPRGVDKAPVAILIGGLDTTKVDYRNVSDMLLARGVATFAFDGPGQGETAFFLRLTPHFEETVSAAIDYLEKRPEIDAQRIGIVGRSLGGYFAPKAAAVDDRVSGPVTRMIWDDSGHCNHDRSHYARPAIADFIVCNL
ncbi:Dienelactone hydrolase and related enzymes [Variovorax sp. HW608]|uniref:alpha/beta hydrolase family protein n=1 Tax=Variovorax sp. HW608 TaxID=1034889 RepID=UPI00081FFD58|nr:alpha/beta hydrolase [Variovorax sp. HW608]SCK14717.1 Dienelactone hydrolase and related enzymes [Variovorax sp. HW608]